GLLAASGREEGADHARPRALREPSAVDVIAVAPVHAAWNRVSSGRTSGPNTERHSAMRIREYPTRTPPDPSRPGRPVATAPHRAAGRVVDILELLATTRDGFALKDLSRRLSTPKSSLLPLLRTLTARGYLEHVRAGEYQLGAKALDLGRG